ncbi:CG34253 [Drosophila busckii]|uniref:CG34253 n=1 Tax=Drosophila busckii TaxID=30019 RepID=A0A0M4F0R7_DROBS|nr:uncharacterized protein LOC108598611 [Drosophila busckii]ALC44382.1 CG34253 [Drosophila busckii]
MKSAALHKLLTLLTLLLLLMFVVPAYSQPLSQPSAAPTSAPAAAAERPLILIENNVKPEDASNYQITLPKNAKPGVAEPCLTISWKTNPDGSQPDLPRIYMVNGYFQIMPPATGLNNNLH